MNKNTAKQRQPDYLIEVPGVYDGWSIAVLNDPYVYVNRWAEVDDPLTPAPGCERRYRMTEDYIEASGVPRGRLSAIDWG
jgi:hypothetical protein